MDTLLSRITIDPAVCHGKPCVRGLRYPVETLLELLSSGMTPDEILADYEDLERDDLLAVLAFAARLARTRRLQPVGPELPRGRPTAAADDRWLTAAGCDAIHTLDLPDGEPDDRRANQRRGRPGAAGGGHEGRRLRGLAPPPGAAGEVAA